VTSTASLGMLLTAALVSASLLGVLGLAGSLLARPLWAHAPYLAPAYGLLSIGLAGTIVFFAWVLAPAAGATCGLLAVLLAVVGLALHAWRLHRQGLLTGLLPSATNLALVALGLLVLALGLLLLWGAPVDLYYAARERFSHPLPNDNELPAIIAARLLEGTDPRGPIGSWLSSDRPPLQTGLLLLVQGDTAWTPIPEVTQSFATSVVSQLCWVPAVYALSRSLRFSPRGSLGAIVFAGLSGTVLVNTVFTWPKLLSAGFVLAALAIAIDLRTRRVRSPFAATVAIAGLAAFGILSHGAALFAFPVLAVVLWWARRSVSVAGLATGGLLAFVLYAPWLAYQRLYDPPGDRLLKWHLAGVIEVNDDPFLGLLVSAYRNLPFGTLVENKLANLAVPLGLHPPDGSRSLGILSDLRAEQFYSLVGALSLAVLPLALMLGTAARTRWSHRLGPTPATRASGLMVACGAAVVVWCLVLFGPGTTWVHSGTHVPILLATCLPMAWLIDRAPRWAGLLGIAQLGVLALLYIPHNYPGFPALFSRRAALTAVIALLLLVWALRRTRTEGSATADGRTGPSGQDGPGTVSLSAGTGTPFPGAVHPGHLLPSAHRNR
jgi:hypothetical protein